MRSCAPRAIATAETHRTLERKEGLRARRRRQFRHTTLSKHREPLAPSLVAREFEVSKPNQVWVSDLTYLPTETGFAYLDLFARRVVGWAVSDNLDATVAVTALQRALALRPAPDGLVHHSDRGVHYACAYYRAVLKQHGGRCSMSRKGNCWDNSVAESFFSSLRFELEDHAHWRDAREVERAIAAYIDGFYNPERRHSHGRNQSPVDFERGFANKDWQRKTGVHETGSSLSWPIALPGWDDAGVASSIRGSSANRSRTGSDLVDRGRVVV